MRIFCSVSCFSVREHTEYLSALHQNQSELVYSISLSCFGSCCFGFCPFFKRNAAHANTHQRASALTELTADGARNPGH